MLQNKFSIFKRNTIIDTVRHDFDFPRNIFFVSEFQSDSKEVKDSGKSLFKETWKVGDKKKKTFDFIVSWTSRELN